MISEHSKAGVRSIQQKIWSRQPTVRIKPEHIVNFLMTRTKNQNGNFFEKAAKTEKHSGNFLRGKKNLTPIISPVFRC